MHGKVVPTMSEEYRSSSCHEQNTPVVRKYLKEMVARVGIEPTTRGFSDGPGDDLREPTTRIERPANVYRGVASRCITVVDGGLETEWKQVASTSDAFRGGAGRDQRLAASRYGRQQKRAAKGTTLVLRVRQSEESPKPPSASRQRRGQTGSANDRRRPGWLRDRTARFSSLHSPGQ